MRSPIYTKCPWQQEYDQIIDVRSEKEFAEDHFPGAINLPVLYNEEREKVGTIYQQISPFEAKKIGAALVAKNISQHLINHFAHQDKHQSFLVYCWRGGQRSHSLASVLTQIGWKVTVIDGGYKTYRSYVREQLETLCLTIKCLVLSGLTGTGKTFILQQLKKRGVQVLDLEALANHRGSLLGQEFLEKPLPQPSQKRFESLLLAELQGFDLSKPVWLEAESSKIGNLYLPSVLWTMMKQARCIELSLPKAMRIKWLLAEYSHFIENIENTEILKNTLANLKHRYGWQKIQEWYALIEHKNWGKLVDELLTKHYDPAYNRSLNKVYNNVIEKLVIPDLSTNNVEKVLDILSQY